jgi:glucarate dehydratase
MKLAESRVEEYGFRTVKLKGGILSPKKDIETIRLMREGFGEDIALRIDPQWMWTPQQALRACKELDKYDLEYIEDPTETLTGMSMIRRHVKTPFSTDGWIFCIWPEMFKLNAMLNPPGVDIVLSDAHYWGGISGIKELLATCNAMQLGLSYHTTGEFGISTAAIVQFAATVQTLQYALDTCYPEPPDDIIKEGWKFRKGSLKVPDKPGLGVELDEKKVEKYHELYKKEGLYKWYLDPFKPGWTPKIGEFRWEDYQVETDRYQAWLKTSKERGYSVEKW